MVNPSEQVMWLLLTICTVTDLTRGKIYNAVTFSFFGAGLAYSFYAGGLSATLWALSSAATAVALFLPLYLASVLFAGDVKLLMACAVWVSPVVVVQLAAVSVVFAAGVGGLLLIRIHGVAGAVRHMVCQLRGPHRLSTSSFKMPFAPSVLCAYFVVHIAELRQWQLL